MKDTYAYKPKKCPNCKQTPLATILYGMPTAVVAEQNNIILGGCCITLDTPQHKWGCTSCGARFYKL